MKPRKTRIKVVTTTGGAVKYIPQHKRWAEWYDFDDLSGISWFEHTEPYLVWINDDWRAGFSTLEHAQKLIDTYIETYNDEESKRKGGKVVDVKYIKYP